jgi:hypothetical protein
MYPQDPVVEDNLFEEEELHDQQNRIDRFDVQLTANEFIAAEDDIKVCSDLVDSFNPNWRNDLREELLHDNIEGKLSILEDNELLAGKQDAGFLHRIQNTVQIFFYIFQNMIHTVIFARNFAVY